jgi:hypothetical protein
MQQHTKAKQMKKYKYHQKNKTHHITMNRNITRIKMLLKTQPTNGKHHHKQHHEQWKGKTHSQITTSKNIREEGRTILGVVP